MICWKPKPSQGIFVYRKSFFFFAEKEPFKEKWSGGLNDKRKEGILTALATTIKKGLATSIRKHTNGRKVLEKTIRTAIKQDLRPGLKPLRNAIWSVLINKANATPH